jgi:hypothetical protein
MYFYLAANMNYEISSIGEVGDLIASGDPNLCKRCVSHILTDLVPEMNRKAVAKGRGASIA